MRKVIVVAVAAMACSATPASAAVRNHYCSPTGDYCQGVEPNKPKVTLGLHTFSFRGRYKLCTRFSSEHAYTCHSFQLRGDSNGVYGSSVRWQQFFPHARHGRYFAKWISSGNQVGPIIWFGY